MWKVFVCGVLCASASTVEDTTAGYIDRVPWSVDIVAPKVPFVGVQEGNPAVWCKYSVSEILTRALYLDEQEAPAGREVVTAGPLRRFEQLMNFFGDIFMQLDRKEKVFPSGPSLPVALDPQASTEAKLRTLVTSLVVAANVDNHVFDKAVQAHALLQTPNQRTHFVNQLLQRPLKHEAEGEAEGEAEADGGHNPLTMIYDALLGALKSKEPGAAPAAGAEGVVEELVAQVFKEDASGDDDPTYTPGMLDKVPDTVVGWMSSRVMGELFAELLTDSYHPGFVHDARGASLGQALCRAIRVGGKIDYLPEITGCTLLAVVTNLLTCGKESTRVTCPAPDAIQTIHYPIDECELLPDEFKKQDVVRLSFAPREEAVDPLTNTLTESGKVTDGPSLYMLQVAGLHNDDVVTQGWCQTDPSHPAFVSQLIPGWDVVHTVWLNEDNDPTSYTAPTKVAPFASMAQRKRLETDAPGECEFLMATRGTATAFEWFVNLQLAQTPIPLFDDPDVKAHTQYSNVALKLVESFNNVLLNKHFLVDPEDKTRYCNPNETTLWFTGHSLGGGMANMESFMAAQFWKVRKGFTGMKVNTYALASMRIFNEKAHNLYAELVNQRNARFEYDVVPAVGCPGVGIPRCNPALYPSTVHGVGSDDVEPELPGLILIDGKRDFQDLDPELSYFNDLSFVYLATDPIELIAHAYYLNMPVPLQFGVAHTCSYRCFTSQFCSTDPLKRTMCTRGTINEGNPDNCMDNDPPGIGDYFNNDSTWLGSLSCAHNLPTKADPLPQLRADICGATIPGLSGTSIAKLLTGGSRTFKSEEL